MKERPTTELLDILNRLEPDEMDTYIRNFGSASGNTSLFSEYLAAHHLTAAAVVQNCQGFLSKSYVYDVLNGTKTSPSRDVVLLLCLACRMNRRQTRRVLENYGHRDLYAKDTRDIILVTYMNQENFDINQINDELFRYHLPLLVQHK